MSGNRIGRVEPEGGWPRSSTTRQWVDAFADETEAKLAENRHKGDREGWQHKSALGFLLPKLLNEVAELTTALADLEQASFTVDPKEIRRTIVSECADISAFAMMIADVAGHMQSKRQRRDR